MRTPAEHSFRRIDTLPSDGAPDALTLAGCSPILFAMETGHSPRPALAALLSALLPGLGQFYNRQWGKGIGFLLGFFVLGGALTSSIDLEQVQQAAALGNPVDNIGQLAILMLLLLALAVWSIVDAVRTAKQKLERNSVVEGRGSHE